jgi:hypothetical protein
MKIHMTKRQAEERHSIWQLLRLAKPTPCYEIHCWFELNDEERRMLDQNPDAKEIRAIDYSYRGLDISPKVSWMTDPKNAKTGGWRFVAYSGADALDLEQRLTESAHGLKGHLAAVTGFEGASVEEI